MPTGEARHRERFVAFWGGGTLTQCTKWRWQADFNCKPPFPSLASAPTREISDDFITRVGPFVEPYPLTISKDYGHSGRVNGTYEYQSSSVKTSRRIFENWTNPRFGNPDNMYLGAQGSSLGSNTFLTTRLLASTSVASPPVDVALFLWELREFPRLLRSLGDFLRRRRRGPYTPGDTASRYLEYSFGWRPLMNDLRSLIDLQQSINDRLNLLKSISEHARFRRTLASYSNNGDFRTGFGYSDIQMDVRWSENHNAWATGRYVPRDRERIKQLTDRFSDAQHDYAKSLALNYSLSPGFIWNAIPWTWLIDYFVNVGDFIESVSGILYTDLTDVCLMRHHRSEETSSPYSVPQGLSVTGHRYVKDLKTRVVIGTARPGISWDPVLSGSQSAILASLATARFFSRTGFR